MAAVTPVTANKCVGAYADGTIHRKHYCYKGLDQSGNLLYTCAAWRKFRVQCPKVNQLCPTRSEAWLPAITVCNQGLF